MSCQMTFGPQNGNITADIMLVQAKVIRQQTCVTRIKFALHLHMQKIFCVRYVHI